MAYAGGPPVGQCERFFQPSRATLSVTGCPAWLAGGPDVSSVVWACFDNDYTQNWLLWLNIKMIARAIFTVVIDRCS